MYRHAPPVTGPLGGGKLSGPAFQGPLAASEVRATRSVGVRAGRPPTRAEPAMVLASNPSPNSTGTSAHVQTANRPILPSIAASFGACRPESQDDATRPTLEWCEIRVRVGLVFPRPAPPCLAPAPGAVTPQTVSAISEPVKAALIWLKYPSSKDQNAIASAGNRPRRKNRLSSESSDSTEGGDERGLGWCWSRRQSLGQGRYS
jgi:hypothetical protein